MTAETTISSALAQWCVDTPAHAIPDDVLASTRLRLLDMLGLGIASVDTPIGAALMSAVGQARCGHGGATVLSGPAHVPEQTASFINAGLAEALDFGDSHNETVVHVTSPVAAASLAAAEVHGLCGREFLRIMALASELTCRVALAAPGAFHSRGFHPTGIFGAFGSAAAASLARRLDVSQFINALGIVGGFSSGLLESWADGTWAKSAQPGWAAMAGTLSAGLAQGGLTGPATIIEGRAGIYASHIQGNAVEMDFPRIVQGLGTDWESRNISFKPYPNAHIMHGVVDAALDALQTAGFEIEAVESIVCLIAPYMTDILCEPLGAKRRPATSAQARMSVPYTVAELFRTGRMDLTSYSTQSLADTHIQNLADRISYEVKPQWTERLSYPGGIRVHLRNGEVIERISPANRGSRANPMTQDEIEAKFRANTASVLSPEKAETMVAEVVNPEGPSVIRLMSLARSPSS